jgi:hypothetical protein
MAVPVAIIVIFVVAGGYFFLTRSSTTTASSSTGTSPAVPVQVAVDRLVKYVNDRNVDGLVTFYSQSSVVHWSGNTGGLSGLYTGAGDIKLIYATSIGKTTKLVANISKYAEERFSPIHINATFVLAVLGNSSALGALNATINVSQEWKWAGGSWQILRENWVYAYFSASNLNIGGPSTTFPQWAVMQKGGNPDLVSEKSFEWHAGPYLAAGAYVLLFAIVLMTTMRLRSRDRDRGATPTP